MTLRDALGTLDCEFIEYRTIYAWDDKREDVFTGACACIDGNLSPLDGGSYSLDDEIDGYTWWRYGEGISFNDVKVVLTVWKVNVK